MRPLMRRLPLGPSRRSSRAASSATAIRLRRGFSIVEVIVAIMMLAIGVLALVSSSTVVIRQLTMSAQRTTASSIAAQRLERLRSVNLCGNLAAGSATTWGMVEQWAIAEVPRQSGQRSFTVDHRLIYSKGRVMDTLYTKTNIPCNTADPVL